jgi:hypothetical protein
MMKTSLVSSLFAGLLVFAFIVNPADAAVPARALSLKVMTQRCAQAVVATRHAKGLADNLEDFTLDPDSLKIKDDYVVKIFQLKAGLKSPVNYVGIIERGPESDAEIPRFAGICRYAAPPPTLSRTPGDIDFHSHTGDKISILFRLNKTVGDPRHLRYTSWKASGEASIWMVGPFTEGADHDPPSPKDWPGCLKPKVVSLKDPDIFFQFDRCANTGQQADQYEYAIHMDQSNAGVTVDISIDPMIINRP